MSAQDNHIEDVTTDELLEQIEEDKKQVKKSSVFAFAALIALIALAIAWFVMNNRVSGTSGNISADAKSVELRTDGYAGIHDDLLKKIMGSEQTTGSKNFWYELGDTVNKFFETSSEKYTINWLLSDQSNMGNYDNKNNKGEEVSNWETYWKNPPKGAERQDEAIEPGSSGRLTFYVVPKYDGKVELNMDLSMIPYKVNGDTFTEVTEGNDSVAKNFVDGHILFCLEKGTETDKKEIQWIKDGTFQLEIQDAKKGQKYGYTLYWCWPQSFGEAVLKADDSYLNGRQPLFSEFKNCEAIRKEISLTDNLSMVNKPERYFYSNLTNSPLPIGQKELREITDMYVKDNSSQKFDESEKNAFVDLSSYYNQADQYIGKYVDCVRIKLTGEYTEGK